MGKKTSSKIIVVSRFRVLIVIRSCCSNKMYKILYNCKCHKQLI
ncbi:hypothetical protein ACMBCN_02865 [Candidatus Liberibacter asiaticus]